MHGAGGMIMAINNEMCSREDLGWWDGNAKSDKVGVSYMGFAIKQ
jgi:hypothetical protein